MEKRAVAKQHADGTWYAQPYLGTNRISGKKMRPYRRFPDAACREEAQAMADEWFERELAAMAGLKVADTVRDRVQAYITDSIAVWKPATVRSYQSSYDCYVEPLIGDLDLAEVSVAVVRTWQAMAIRGSKDRKGVSSSTVAKAHSMLSGAWNQFMTDGLVAYNPFLGTQPKRGMPEAVAFDEGEYVLLMGALMRGMSDDSTDEANVRHRMMCFAAYMALRTGVRCGEACGVAAGDWRGVASELLVSHSVGEAGAGKPFLQTTKGGGFRTASLDAATNDCFKAHVEWLGRIVGRVGRRTPLVTMDGSLMRPSAISRDFRALLDELGLPKDTHFHTLRHTHATFQLESGANIRLIQQRLGHADIRTTLALYSHLLPGADKAAASQFAAYADGLEFSDE